MYRKELCLAENWRVIASRCTYGWWLIGAMAGGALGAGTAELVKRESPAARLIAKIQTQNGRLTSADAAQLQELLTDTYSNISDYRS